MFKLLALMLCALALSGRAALAGEACSMSDPPTVAHELPSEASPPCHETAEPPASKPQHHTHGLAATCTCAAMTAIAALPQPPRLAIPVYAVAWRNPNDVAFRSAEVAPGDRPPAV